jgi:glutamate-ammonia-ligase adenylyltransferase
LRFGGTHRGLRTPNTVEALMRLRTDDLVTTEAYDTLISAIHFLRQLENGLRLIHDRSLNEFREEPEELEELARHLYRGDLPPKEGARRLLQDFLRHTEAVRQLYCSVFETAD